jgi:hypothetical protein
MSRTIGVSGHFVEWCKTEEMRLGNCVWVDAASIGLTIGINRWEGIPAMFRVVGQWCYERCIQEADASERDMLIRGAIYVFFQQTGGVLHSFQRASKRCRQN